MPPWKIVRGQRVSQNQIVRARELRLDLTLEEALLWDRLRKNRLLGYHFRRQQLIAGYVVDFYCHRASLAIEVDGGIHKFRRGDDRKRDAILLERGIRVIRFTNEQVREHIDEVLGVIVSCLEPTPPTPSPRAQSRGLPWKGKGGRSAA